MKKIRTFKKYVIPIFFLFLFFVIIFLPICAKSQLWIDEVLDSDPAYNLAFNQKLVLSVWAGKQDVEKHYFMRPPVHFIILSWLYKLFGFRRAVTLSLSMLSAIFSFCMVYLIAILLTNDSLVSIFSSLLLAFSSLGASIAKWGVTDATALFFFTGSLFLFLISQRYDKYLRRILIIFSGVAMGLAGQSHQLYIILFFSFIFYYIFELRHKNKDWLKEMVIFSAAFLATFIIWFSFILKDIHAFKIQTLGRIFNAAGLNNISKSNPSDFFIERLKGIFYISLSISPLTLVFFVIGNFLFIKKLPQHKKLIMGFVLLPVLILFLLNILKGTYPEILLPLGFIGIGFSVVYLLRLSKLNWDRNKKKYAIVLVSFAFLFMLFHITFGIGGRYFMILKNWQIRDLAAYEREINKLVLPGSNVLGGPENWYVLTRTGSKLFLFECAEEPSFDWGKLDYIILSTLHSGCILLQTDSFLSKFIKERCTEIARVGKDAYSYRLLGEGCGYSGYHSIIYKVNKQGRSYF